MSRRRPRNISPENRKLADEYLQDIWYEPYAGEIDIPGLAARRRELSRLLEKPSVLPFYEPLSRLSTRLGDPFDFDSDIVCFGAGTCAGEETRALQEALQALIPWRKGPFSYYGIEIDAEWRSYLKWDRVLSMLPDLKNRKICDVGCNNGYYMYRMLSGNPWFILGIDPMVRYYFHHRLNRKFYRNDRLCFDLLGVEDLGLFPRFFDVIFFMGILYHRRDPMGTLGILHRAMRPGGTLIIESCGIPGEGPYCLFPPKRYMKAPGYWFLPTATALKGMAERAGFRNVEIFDCFKLDVEEQRQTPWAIYESLEHFLDPRDSSKTLEGHPAPWRIYARAVK